MNLESYEIRMLFIEECKSKNLNPKLILKYNSSRYPETAKELSNMFDRFSMAESLNEILSQIGPDENGYT